MNWRQSWTIFFFSFCQNWFQFENNEPKSEEKHCYQLAYSKNYNPNFWKNRPDLWKPGPSLVATTTGCAMMMTDRTTARSHASNRPLLQRGVCDFGIIDIWPWKWTPDAAAVANCCSTICLVAHKKICNCISFPSQRVTIVTPPFWKSQLIRQPSTSNYLPM